MAIQAGVGMSHHRNPKVAGKEAVQKALEAAGIDKPDFVFMFASVGYDQQTLLNAVNEATGGAPLCGCSGEGIIAEGEADESNFSVGVMAIRSDQLRFENGIATGLTESSEKVGHAIAEGMQSDVCSDTLALFVFPDGLAVNFGRLATVLEKELNLEHPLPIVGGMACDNLARTRTYQYCNDQVVSDGVAWTLLSGQAQMTWAVSHGCVPIGVEHTITRCAGNVIYEMDGKPVREILGDYLTDEELRDEAKIVFTFSFGLKAPEQIRVYDEYVIQGIYPIRDETTNLIQGFWIAAEVTEGTSIWVTQRNYEKMVNGLDRTIEEIRTHIGENPVRLMLQFECGGRGKIFLSEQEKLQLLGTLRQRLGEDIPWLGFYACGEIAPVGGQNYFHNYSAVLAAIY